MEGRSASSSGPVGLIAGAGRLPLEAISALEAQGETVAAVVFEGLGDPGLAERLPQERLRSLRLGDLGALRRALESLGVRRLLLVGKVPKTLLLAGGGLLSPDAEALALLGRLADRRDEPLLGAIAGWLAEAGFELLAQDRWLAPLLATAGPIAARAPSASERADAELGRAVVAALGRADVGQSVVVKQGCVLAVEAIEGTDEAIRRAGALGGPGATVVKAARPGQDRRFDLPAVGPDTLESMRQAGASALAIEAGAGLILDRAAFVAAADRAGLAVWGFEPGGSTCGSVART